MSLNKNALIFKSIGGEGYIPLLREVERFDYHYREPYLELWITFNGHYHHDKVVILRKES